MRALLASWLAASPGLLVMALALALVALVHPAAWAQGIFVCIDAKGRKLTADRPIIDCIDREQREITPSGMVVRRIGPSLTAQERAAQEERARKAADERARIIEDKRRDRALLTRYPERAAHDRERAAAVAIAGEVLATAHRRLLELEGERRKLDQELEFYKGDLAKAPPVLRRQSEAIEQQSQAQKRFIAHQQEEKRRISARYDAELVRLNVLWEQHAGAAAPAVQTWLHR